MHLYDYRITLELPSTDFNSRNTRTVAAGGFIYRVKNKNIALRRFLKQNFPNLRKNGVIRGVRQAKEAAVVTRIASHPVKTRKGKVS